MDRKRSTSCILVISLFCLSGCANLPTHKAQNACFIFEHYNSWYWTAQKAEKKWNVPIPVMLSIIYQESGFKRGAKPPRTRLFWIIPWKRPTTAYGYCQAVDSTWERYKKENKKSNVFRNSFKDSLDFIGWYVSCANKKAGINKKDVKELYLAYHEGITGYIKRAHFKKPWLLKTAMIVKARARMYKRQMQICKETLPKKPWYRFFS